MPASGLSSQSIYREVGLRGFGSFTSRSALKARPPSAVPEVAFADCVLSLRDRGRGPDPCLIYSQALNSLVFVFASSNSFRLYALDLTSGMWKRASFWLPVVRVGPFIVFAVKGGGFGGGGKFEFGDRGAAFARKRGTLTYGGR